MGIPIPVLTLSYLLLRIRPSILASCQWLCHLEGLEKDFAALGSFIRVEWPEAPATAAAAKHK